ncbi:MAG: apolipoprotein N-acyltransferase [Proteobacteria bacterium]|nr:apolipoprotein N-acyltransferase [Pseudomonadota bacterium]
MPKKPRKARKKIFATRLSEALASLSLRKRYGASFAVGALAVLALPPFYVFPVLLIAFPLLMEMLHLAGSKRQAFFTGWWFGFGHFVFGLYWIANSLLVDAVHFAWLIPFAVSLIPAVLAIYTGLFAVFMHRLRLNGWRRVLTAASLWVLIEFARSYLFTGFPWNLIGYSWVVSDAVMQLASITGVWGLSLLAMLFALSPLLWMHRPQRLKGIILLLLPALVWCGGFVRLSESGDPLTATTIRVVQANIKQEMKWEGEYRFKTFMQHVMASVDHDLAPADIIVWPETAVPFVLEREQFIQDILRKMMPPESVVITGALHIEGDQADYSIWNALYAVSARGKVLGVYDKVRLVPFGEYVPFRTLLPFVDKITYGSKDFSSGAGAKSLQVKGAGTFAPVICYEVIYPDGIIDEENRPDWIVNITNDAWFGNSTGPYQHFAMARMRAVEQGLPLVRAANTGISGVFDAYGRVLARAPLNHAGAIQMPLPKSLSATLYSKIGGFRIMVCITLLLFIATSVQQKHTRK